ncbi:MAG: glycosyltransferase family 4 protein [Acidimicrobiales bacterium]
MSAGGLAVRHDAAVGRPLRVVVDGVPVRGTSLAVVVENLLKGWDQLDAADDLHVVLGPPAHLQLPPSVTVHRAEAGGRALAGRLWAQNATVPGLCRRLGADVMLGVVPATSVAPLPCPRAIIALDLRHEQRPEQFSARARRLRRASYAVGYRQADAIACISERTRRDLLEAHPELGRRPVRVALLGSDHVLSWPAPVPGADYALAFGQWGHKNVDLVVDAWSLLHARGEAIPLVVVGLPAEARAAVQARVERLGLTALISVLPWLNGPDFHQRFASAALVVFPSDYEGFGLPAVEAMRLGIPVVITPDPALLEVSGGHATVMDGWDADALARAVPRARRVAPGDLERAASHAAGLTWRRTAAAVRDSLAACVRGGTAPVPEPAAGQAVSRRP